MSMEEQDLALQAYFLKMLLHTQTQLDHENIVKLLIENNLHQFLIDNLIETSKEKKNLAELDLGGGGITTGDGGASTRSRGTSGGETEDDDFQSGM